MGQLIDGTWTNDAEEKEDGRFRRVDSVFRNWITADGAAGPTGGDGFKAQADRYHLYVSYACPWAHRTLIFRKLKGLEEFISISVVHPDMHDDGWTFDDEFDGATGDTLYGLPFLRDIYVKADPNATTRVTVPILWDKQRETIVSNESADIIRMFNTAFDGLTGSEEDFCPEDLRQKIDTINKRIYETVNNGVYKCGFARSQQAYDEAANDLFDSLDWLENLLQSNRYVSGSRITEADWRLAPTLFRFDAVYHTHFKCNRDFLRDFSALWGYIRELYQWQTIEGGKVADTVRPDHYVRHYHVSHESVSPNRIIPINPVLDWNAPHGRVAT